MKVMMTSGAMGLMLGIGFAAVPAWSMTQEEVDAVVDGRILRYAHHDMSEKAVRRLESKGATRQMLAESFAKVLRRDMNVGVEKVGCAKAHAAIYWLGEFGEGNQLTNLLFVAQNATNWHASSAIDVYYARCSDKAKFIDVAETLLNRPDWAGLHSTIWNLLEKESRGAMRSRVVALAEKRLQDSGTNLFYVDRILADCQPGYAKSLRRLEALRRFIREKRTDEQSVFLRRVFSDRIREAERK